MKKGIHKFKTIVIILGLSFARISGLSQAYVYHPFPDSNATWCLTQVRSDGLNCTGYDFYSYSFGLDSFYNNNNYHSIYLTNVTTIGDTLCAGAFPPFVGLKALIRQDTVTRKVYFIPTGDTIESVLYDFNLSVGDTILNSQCMALTVSSIDSILIGAEYRRRINTSGFTSIIEGIGSTQGLFEPQCDAIDYSWDLLGFSQNNQPLYPDTIGNCSIVDRINWNNPRPVSISYDYESSSVQLNFLNENSDIYLLRVYDILGMLLIEKKVICQNQSVYLPQLSSGFYMIELTSKSFTIVKRILR